MLCRIGQGEQEIAAIAAGHPKLVPQSGGAGVGDAAVHPSAGRPAAAHLDDVLVVGARQAPERHRAARRFEIGPHILGELKDGLAIGILILDVRRLYPARGVSPVAPPEVWFGNEMEVLRIEDQSGVLAAPARIFRILPGLNGVELRTLCFPALQRNVFVRPSHGRLMGYRGVQFRECFLPRLVNESNIFVANHPVLPPAVVDRSLFAVLHAQDGNRDDLQVALGVNARYAETS